MCGRRVPQLSVDIICHITGCRLSCTYITMTSLHYEYSIWLWEIYLQNHYHEGQGHFMHRRILRGWVGSYKMYLVTKRSYKVYICTTLFISWNLSQPVSIENFIESYIFYALKIVRRYNLNLHLKSSISTSLLWHGVLLIFLDCLNNICE